MKTSIILYLAALVSLTFSSCNKDPDEGDRNSYTVKGTLYKGITDEPLAHASLHIEASFHGIPDNTYEVIAEGESDAQGYFEITYKKNKRPDLETLRLYMDNRILLILPNNQNLERDVAELSHARLFVKFISKNYIDSIYASISFLVDDSENISRMNMPISEKEFNVYREHVAANQVSFILKSSYSLAEVDQNLDNVLAFGTNKSSFQHAFNAHHVDSIPDDFQRIYYVQHGFPKVDSLIIEL